MDKTKNCLYIYTEREREREKERERENSEKQLWLAELTVCFETSFEEARERKEEKYSELVAAIEEAGYNTTLITLEMGSWGVSHLPGFTTLAHELAISK